MTTDHLRYDNLIETALREVVRQAMGKVVQNGLPGEHHFYISFLTKHPGVDIPAYLKEKYPEEMTIVLQHQFFGLTVSEEGFSVLLSFNNIRERLTIPYDAITTFADPSVNFALQFQNIPSSGEDDEAEDGESLAPEASESSEKKTEEKRGEVISLDKFRKK
ncbi:MAG: ClpXP protease specificity-enhancing factor SspB [Alphaproteobacteria bacterium]|nr:ClpXP protease specificity-enhancing factor SspB [Alphaproteobacteria bacterium]